MNNNKTNSHSISLRSQKTENQYFVFIDLLGFKEFIHKMKRDSSGELEKKLINFFYDIKNKYYNNPDISSNSSSSSSYTLEYSIPMILISDTIIISYPKEIDTQINKKLPNKFKDQPYNLQSCITTFHYLIDEIYKKALFDLGLLARGVLHYGSIYINPPVIFGQGLIDAYELEKKLSDPAIFISPDILNIHNDREIILNSKYHNIFKNDESKEVNRFFFKIPSFQHKKNKNIINNIIRSQINSNICEKSKRKWEWIHKLI